MATKSKSKILKEKVTEKQTESKHNIESTSELVSENLDNDYKVILMKYDAKKNKSRPVITIYERTLLIGKRATQIANGAIPNIEVKPGMSIIQIAEEELKQRKIPMIIKRTIGDYVEYWKLQDMILPNN